MSVWNYFKIQTVDGYAFPTASQVNFGFISQGFSLLNRGSKIIQYSFDGIHAHGDLDPSDASEGLSFDARFEDRIWFRGVDGYSTCRVESWGSM